MRWGVDITRQKVSKQSKGQSGDEMILLVYNYISFLVFFVLFCFVMTSSFEVCSQNWTRTLLKHEDSPLCERMKPIISVCHFTTTRQQNRHRERKMEIRKKKKTKKKRNKKNEKKRNKKKEQKINQIKWNRMKSKQKNDNWYKYIYISMCLCVCVNVRI